MSLADLGLIGFASWHQCGARAIVWCCMPRFDSAPIFGALLDDDGGQFTIGPATPGLGLQRYLANTNVIETRFESPEGAFRVLDFAPRFVQYDRSFRPTKLVRIVEPLAGTPRIRVSCDPVLGWSKARPQRGRFAPSATAAFGSAPHHNAPLSYLDGERSRSPSANFIFSGARRSRKRWSAVRALHSETVAYWRMWVKH
jgi:GH15 family glucan-1,4-alpha-glucosidase